MIYGQNSEILLRICIFLHSIVYLKIKGLTETYILNSELGSNIKIIFNEITLFYVYIVQYETQHLSIHTFTNLSKYQNKIGKELLK